jgi:hypothetical protein
MFRSVATSDCWAPTAATSARARRLSETETHNYANFPGMAHGNHMNSDDKNFLPGIYAVSLQMFTRFKVAKDKISSYDSTLELSLISNLAVLVLSRFDCLNCLIHEPALYILCI